MSAGTLVAAQWRRRYRVGALGRVVLDADSTGNSSTDRCSSHNDTIILMDLNPVVVHNALAPELHKQIRINSL